jgi:hypothetical protein
VPDLDEAKYTPGQKEDSAAKGKAIKGADGDAAYVIKDINDLRKAIGTIKAGSGDQSKAKAHVVAMAKKLKAENLVPKDWSTDDGKAKTGNPFAAKESVDLPEAVTEEVDHLDTGHETAAEGRLTSSEVVELGEAVKGTGRRRKIQLIRAGWSKNGRYYPASVLAEAAKNKVFPAGTPMYADHPTLTEKVERPERSIRDLAARLDVDARYENGALVSEATSFGTWNQILNGPGGLAENVEVSVRCFGELAEGQAEGREGLIVERITEGRSVDFVTEGAAGGKVLELLEAAQKDEIDEGGSIGASIEARMHTAFTIMCDEMYACGKLTREERIGLSSSVGDALSSFVTRIERDQPQLYERETWQDPVSIGESAIDTGPDPDKTPADVLAGTEIHGPASGRIDTPQEGAEMTESQGGAAPTPGTTRALVEAELAEARRERDRAIARETARALIPQALKDAYIPPSTAIRITESVMSNLPLKGGALDEVALFKEVSRQVEQSEREMAEALQAAGVGSPRDLGSPAAQGYGVDGGELDDRLSGALTRLGGMSEAAVTRAVKGRG